MSKTTQSPDVPPHVFMEMARLTSGLYSNVRDMLALYEEFPDLNQLQPPEFAPALAMSLDDWAPQLRAARDAWKSKAGWTPESDNEAD